MDGILTKRLHADFRTYFDVLDLFTCRVRILIVTDSTSGGFGDTEGFHLGQILKILADDPWSHVQFVVTKAHRQASSETGVLPNFRFNTHDLSKYDQIWLFGIVRESPDALSPQELKAISQFMDGGGGVFATGDHENLGQAMCAEVPRVRSMRRWYHNGSGPAGEPEAPDQTGAGRHDTLVDPAGAPGPDQSDAVPQRIRPRFYTRTLGGGFIRPVVRYPHPVLCGRHGVIDFLPDHMHEGLCEVPSNLTRSFTFDGYLTTEYPTVSGHQEVPQVIAWADSHGTTATDFGVLGAYDGHRVNVGRVLVDATWHHWFNINLTGFLEATDPLSPLYDPSVVPQWEEIKGYFRNVALWLARPNKQDCLRNGGLLVATRYYDILITHRDISRVKDPLLYYWQLGVFARDALGRLAPQCQTLRWIIDLIKWIGIPLDPWEAIPPRPRPDPPPWIDIEQLELVALGGAVDALVTTFGKELGTEKGLQTTIDRREKDIHQVAQRGAARAVSGLVKRAQEGFDALKRLGERAERLNDSRPEPRD